MENHYFTIIIRLCVTIRVFDKYLITIYDDIASCLYPEGGGELSDEYANTPKGVSKKYGFFFFFSCVCVQLSLRCRDEFRGIKRKRCSGIFECYTGFFCFFCFFFWPINHPTQWLYSTPRYKYVDFMILMVFFFSFQLIGRAHVRRVLHAWNSPSPGRPPAPTRRGVRIFPSAVFSVDTQLGRVR